MRILVINSGSGSQSLSLFSMEQAGDPDSCEATEAEWEARFESTGGGQDHAVLRKTGEKLGEVPLRGNLTTRDRTLEMLQMLPPAFRINAVAHRVVHGGPDYDKATRVDARVEQTIEQYAALAPLHNPHSLESVRAISGLWGDSIPQVAVFDTAFHRNLPDAAAVYPGPWRWVEQGIRRYGFHGSSFCWAAKRARFLLNRKSDGGLRLIICHLGGGCSLAAVKGGQSIDTTMGFTPLDGIAMCTRAGSLDPGIILHLLRQGTGVERLEQLLNHESGLAGLSGLPGDTREILPAAETGNVRARLALDVFIHRLRAGIAAMMASLGGPPDALIFTDVIGESAPFIRAAACEPFAFAGVSIDPGRNESLPSDVDVSKARAPVRILVIKSRENWQIACEASDLILAGSKHPRKPVL
jgi:acetate kinase